MKIELRQSNLRFNCSDIVAVHDGKEVVFPAAFNNIDSTDNHSPFEELNVAWSRRSTKSQQALFDLYWCCAQVIRNYIHLHHMHEAEKMVMRSMQPYLSRILNMNNVDAMEVTLHNVYGKETLVPEGFLDVLPENVNPDQTYLSSEYMQLLAFAAVFRSVLPIILGFRETISRYDEKGYNLKSFYEMVNSIMIHPNLDIMKSPALAKILSYVGQQLNGVPMRKTRGLEVQDIMPTLMFRVLARHPLQLLNNNRNMVTKMYIYISQRVANGW